MELVGEARREAKAYYATKKNYPIEAREHLIAAKALEKQIDQVVSEGRLEPDEPTEKQIGLFELDAADLLDSSAE